MCIRDRAHVLSILKGVINRMAVTLEISFEVFQKPDRKDVYKRQQNGIHKGIESSLLKKFLAEKNYASALPIKKVAAKATIA